MAFVKDKMHCNFLSKKLMKNVSKTSEEFSFRFRGKENLSYFKHFPRLCLMMITNLTNNHVKEQVFYCSILLRKIVSYTARIEDFNFEMLKQMAQNCVILFKCCCLFFEKLLAQACGLCVKSHRPMLRRHTRNTGSASDVTRRKGVNKNTRSLVNMQKILLTKTADVIYFVMNTYLRENGFDKKRYFKTTNRYIPEWDDTRCKSFLATS